MTPTPGKDPDWEIFHKWVHGQDQDITDLIQRHQRRLMYIIQILRREHPTEDHEEILQETWEKAFRYAQSKEIRNVTGKFSGWIGTIAANTAKDRTRKERHQPRTVQLSGNDPDDPPPIDNIPKPDSLHQDELVEESELLQSYLNCLKTMTQHFRIVWTMLFEERIPTSKIAERIGLGTCQAVQYRFKQGAIQMENCLKGHGWEIKDIYKYTIEGVPGR